MQHKVLTALFFYATGSYQKLIGAANNISQKIYSVYIEQKRNILGWFYRKYGIPGVVGCIDGSQMASIYTPNHSGRIVVPRQEEEHLYYSRKHYHSLNVQMVCDDEYRILNVNSKFGGANHDSFIFENSDMKNNLKSLHQNGEIVWLLGDSGYPQRPWLMTPILDAEPNNIYNEKHMRARVVIENTFSRLKNRWRCLHKDRVLHYKPLKYSRIILACSVLHNIVINFGIDNIEEDMGQQLADILTKPLPAVSFQYLRPKMGLE
ncbi:unnamed protein product [Euphydryas editha]|nr:unnamed protein product [Euphydryas editha]